MSTSLKVNNKKGQTHLTEMEISVPRPCLESKLKMPIKRSGFSILLYLYLKFICKLSQLNFGADREDNTKARN